MNSKTTPPTTDSPPVIRHILIVDAQDIIRSVLCHLLQSWGFTTRAVGNLACACRMVVSDGPFDAIVCNYDLPDGNAFDLIEWMREQQLEVAAIVPFGTRPPMSRPPGNVKLMSKPFDPLELRDAIDRAARKRAGNIGRATHRRRCLSPRSCRD